MTKREQVVKVAEKYVAKGRVDAAIKEYLKVLKENPNDVSTLNRLGDLYARISRIDEAVRVFGQIADHYTEAGFLVKAIAIYKKIIKLDPTRLQVYEQLAELYHKQGLTNEARTQYQVLGDYYFKHQDAAAAINIYQKMVELEPDNPSHHLKLAELYQRGQLWDKALRSYRTIAELMLQHGRVEEAVRVYQRAIEVHSEDLGFITDAVLGIKDAGHTGAAAKLLASAVAANPQAEKVARLAGLTRGAGHPTPASADPRETLPPPPSLRAAAPTPVAPPRPSPARPSPARPSPPPPSPPPSLPPAEPSEPEEDEFLVLGIDEPSGSMVAPPEDMVEPGTAFQRPVEWQPPPREPVEEAPAAEEEWVEETLEPAAAAPPQEEGWAADLGRISSFSFELPDLTLPELGMEEVDVGALLEGGAEAVSEEAAEAEIEVPLDEEVEALDESVELELDLSELALEPQGGELTPEELASGEPALEGYEEDVGFELELEPIEVESVEVEEEVPAWLEPAAPPVVPSPAAAAPLPPAAPPEEPRVQDLLAEAEVFAKYNLEEKALERLDQVLVREPHHLDALALLVDLHIKGGDAGRVEPALKRLRRAVEERRAPEVWARIQAKLARAGMSIAGESLAPVSSPQEDRVSQLIRDLELPTPSRRRAAPPAPKKKVSVADALAELTSGLERPKAAQPPARPARPAAAAGPAVERPPAPPPAVPPPPAPKAPPPVAAPRPAPPARPPSPAPPIAAAPPPFVAPPEEPFDATAFEEELPDIVLPEEKVTATGADFDDTSMDWLREEPKGAKKAASPDRLFDDEDEFFDLAAELEEELGVEEGKMGGEILAQSEEPTLEEIVEGFKKGVAENLSAEDYDTHYNLGIAYREMGLLDEAIGEFQLAAKAPVHLVDCCSMLGVSFLEKGLPELAVKWYQRGLQAPDLKEEVTLSLLYDMGNVYLAMGDEGAARKTFVELYGINSNYRDVVAKLEELGR